MNTRITALKKKIELREKQLKAKEELAIRSKGAVKEIKHDIELLQNELAKEEMQEMMDLMGEKNINIDDVKAAIASGIITGSAATENKETDIPAKMKEKGSDSKEENNNAE
ncbi:MAG: hypothetical protein NC452_11620 [Eubacterium sp.]|nr:hypothetical protein [Eubacterium sp.]